MAHFFKYNNRPLHAGTKEFNKREEINKRMRESGLKAGNTQTKPTQEQSDEAKKRYLTDLEFKRKLRELAKKKSIKNILNKSK